MHEPWKPQTRCEPHPTRVKDTLSVGDHVFGQSRLGFGCCKAQRGCVQNSEQHMHWTERQRRIARQHTRHTQLVRKSGVVEARLERPRHLQSAQPTPEDTVRFVCATRGRRGIGDSPDAAGRARSGSPIRSASPGGRPQGAPQQGWRRAATVTARQPPLTYKGATGVLCHQTLPHHGWVPACQQKNPGLQACMQWELMLAELKRVS